METLPPRSAREDQQPPHLRKPECLPRERLVPTRVLTRAQEGRPGTAGPVGGDATGPGFPR